MQKQPWKFVTFKFPGRIASLLRGSFFCFSKWKKKRISAGRGTGNGRSDGEEERFQLCAAKRIVGKRKHGGNTLEKQMYISLDQRNQFGWTSSSLIYHDLFFSPCSFSANTRNACFFARYFENRIQSPCYCIFWPEPRGWKILVFFTGFWRESSNIFWCQKNISPRQF